MEKVKPERIEGTRHVKLNNTVYSTVAKDAPTLKTICECLWCGERFGGDVSGKCAMYCKNCRTAAGRKEVTDANNLI